MNTCTVCTIGDMNTCTVCTIGDMNTCTVCTIGDMNTCTVSCCFLLSSQLVCLSQGRAHLRKVCVCSDATFPKISGIPDIGKSVRPIRKPSGNGTYVSTLLNEVVRSHHAESSGNFVRLLWHPCVWLGVL